MTEFNEAKELKRALEESTRAMIGAIEYLEACKPKRPENVVYGYMRTLEKLNVARGQNNMIISLINAEERKKREEKDKAEQKKQKKLEEAAIINNFKEGTK